MLEGPHHNRRNANAHPAFPPLVEGYFGGELRSLAHDSQPQIFLRESTGRARNALASDCIERRAVEAPKNGHVLVAVLDARKR